MDHWVSVFCYFCLQNMETKLIDQRKFRVMIRQGIVSALVAERIDYAKRFLIILASRRDHISEVSCVAGVESINISGAVFGIVVTGSHTYSSSSLILIFFAGFLFVQFLNEPRNSSLFNIFSRHEWGMAIQHLSHPDQVFPCKLVNICHTH